MQREGADILIGLDLGTSVVKAVAFDLEGNQLAAASVLNAYDTGADGSATQPLARTWADCAAGGSRAGGEGRRGWRGERPGWR